MGKLPNGVLIVAEAKAIQNGKSLAVEIADNR
jgi:hypothetical protein